MSQNFKIALSVVIIMALIAILIYKAFEDDQVIFENYLEVESSQTNQENRDFEEVDQATDKEDEMEETNKKENSSENENYLTYNNTVYGWSVKLPARWANYKVTEKSDEYGRSYTFELPHNTNSYGQLFTINAHPRVVWEDLKDSPPYNYLGEKNAYVFSYTMGHDDEGYEGFPEVKPNVQIKGPLSDVQDFIIPSFTLN